MGDNSSCGSRAVDSNSVPSYFSRKQAQKAEICNEILRRLRDLDVEEAGLPDFEDQLMAHIHRFTPSYALDLNLDRPLDVLVHKRLLQMASHPDTRPAIDIRLAQAHSPANGDNVDSRKSSSSGQIERLSSDFSSSQSLHLPPAPGILPSAELELTVNSLPAHDVERPGSCNPNLSG